jgi:hypothetical protein
MATENVIDSVVRRFQWANQWLADELQDYVSAALSEDPMPWALRDWFVDDTDMPVVESLANEDYAGSAFMQWFLFNWVPSPQEAGPGTEARRTWPIAEAFAEAHRGRLDPDVEAVLRSSVERTWGLWSLAEVRPNGFVEFENVFCQERVTAYDPSIGRSVSRGSMIHAGFTRFENMHFIACSSVIVPPIWRSRLVQMREELADGRPWLTPHECVEYEHEIRFAYLSIVHQLLDPSPPQLNNMEGDPLRFVEQTFRLHVSPEEAFERLHDLAAVHGREELLERATRDEQGRLVEIEFQWDKRLPNAPMDETIVATFTIRGDELLVETNSDRRARNAKAMVKRRLGDRAEYVGAKRTDPAEFLQRGGEEGGEEAGAPPVGPVPSTPEMEAFLREHMRKRWELWLDEEIPALDGETPRQAATSERGRELLEALLADYEQTSADNVAFAPDIPDLRRKLGI